MGFDFDYFRDLFEKGLLEFEYPAKPGLGPVPLETKAMKEETIESGDIVRLRIGGPLMIVDDVTNFRYECVWIDASGRPWRKNYTNTSLVVIDIEEGGNSKCEQKSQWRISMANVFSLK